MVIFLNFFRYQMGPKGRTFFYTFPYILYIDVYINIFMSDFSPKKIFIIRILMGLTFQSQKLFTIFVSFTWYSLVSLQAP